MRFGPFDVYSIVTGTFRLDGGAMFGVVPKVLWQNCAPPDDLNRISMTMRTLLAVDGVSRRVILVDTGCGPKWQPRDAERYAIRNDAEAVPRALGALGLTVEQVTDVVVTHLHFDHNGGLTTWKNEPGGATCLIYPQARHWLHERQWAHAQNPHPKDQASYLREDFAGLAESGVLNLVEGDNPAPPFPGMEWFLSHGHTPYQLLPMIGEKGGQILFTGDVFPTVVHLRPTWVMAYDVEPMTTIEEKTAIIQRCLSEGLKIAFPHDPTHAAVDLAGPSDRPIVAQRLVLGLTKNG